MKTMTWLLPFMLCGVLISKAALQDDIARAFLQGVAAQGVAPILTNTTVVTPLGTAILTATNVGSLSVAGGLVYFDLGRYTNLNGAATLTNLASVTIPGHTLTNLGDALRGQWSGRMPLATVNTNQFQITYGGTVVLDTGLLPASNTVFNAEVLIVRTGNSGQHIEAVFTWGPGNGVSFIRTNINMELTLANGAPNVLALRGAARRGGAHTNNSFFIQWTGLR